MSYSPLKTALFELYFLQLMQGFVLASAAKSCPFLKECTCLRDRITKQPEVYCQERHLVSVPDLSSFKQEISRLILTGNKIAVLSRDSFAHAKVRELDLSNNPLKTVDPDALRPLRKSLEILAVSFAHSKLKKMKFLEKLSRLKRLSLDGNSDRTTDLPSAMFASLGLKMLRTLSFKRCGIAGIPNDAFIGLERLEEMDLSYNGLERVPRALLRLKSLRRLSLKCNRLTGIGNNDFLYLDKLRRLDLSGNQFSRADAISDNAFAGLERNLRALDLGDCGLRAVPVGAINILESLAELDLSHNAISVIERCTFSADYDLKKIDVSGNPVRLGRGAFCGLEDSLTELGIREMNLTRLPGPLSSLRKLQVLDASGNEMSALDAGFNTDAPRVNHFTLRGMEIARVSAAAFGKHDSPIFLDLGSNSISDVSFVLEAPPCTFRKVVLSENPVSCDCGVLEAVQRELLSPDGRCEDGRRGGGWLQFGGRPFETSLVQRCGGGYGQNGGCVDETLTGKSSPRENEAPTPSPLHGGVLWLSVLLRSVLF